MVLYKCKHECDVVLSLFEAYILFLSYFGSPMSLKVYFGDFLGSYADNGKHFIRNMDIFTFSMLLYLLHKNVFWAITFGGL